eukprot:364208-Chlamydomonas_euryale.AAC.13
MRGKLLPSLYEPGQNLCESCKHLGRVNFAGPAPALRLGVADAGGVAGATQHHHAEPSGDPQPGAVLARGPPPPRRARR